MTRIMVPVDGTLLVCHYDVYSFHGYPRPLMYTGVSCVPMSLTLYLIGIMAPLTDVFLLD